MPEDPASRRRRRSSRRPATSDAFNWGYDPFHFTTPEGSYATDPDGESRIREFREMVAALNDLGLRMVKSTWSTTTPTRPVRHERSVLDRIVPGYYHRLSTPAWSRPRPAARTPRPSTR
jgi:pullulanase/glycogen debranching enzyme